VSRKLTYTFQTLIPRSLTVGTVNLRCCLFGHTWVHPWSYQPIIPLQT